MFSGLQLHSFAAISPELTAADTESGRLKVRHSQPAAVIAPGEYVLDDNNRRRAVLYVPAAYNAAVPAPFMMMLHGARGDGDLILQSQRAAADEHGVILLCPQYALGYIGRDSWRLRA